MTHGAPYAIGAFALCAALSLLPPRTAVAEATLLGGNDVEGAAEGLTDDRACETGVP